MNIKLKQYTRHSVGITKLQITLIDLLKSFRKEDNDQLFQFLMTS